MIINIKIRPPGIEPETPAWKADMLPLHYDRYEYKYKYLYINNSKWIKLVKI